MIRRRRNRQETIEIVVNRRTKGMAFNPPPEGYDSAYSRIAQEVTNDYDTMNSATFYQKYANHLFDHAFKYVKVKS